MVRVKVFCDRWRLGEVGPAIVFIIVSKYTIEVTMPRSFANAVSLAIVGKSFSEFDIQFCFTFGGRFCPLILPSIKQ